MRNSKVILISYSLFFLAILYFAIQFSDTILGIRVIDLAEYKLLSLMPLKDFCGFIIAISIVGYLWSAKKGHYRAETDNIIDELRKCITPTKDETRVTTISVFVFVAIMSVIFLVFDIIWSNLSHFIYM